jgi:hypothetical protein
MRRVILIIVVLLLVLTSNKLISSCVNNDVEECFNADIDSIVVSYLDWDLKTQGALTCEDVKDFNNGRNDKFVVKNIRVIQQFVRALSIVEFDLIMSKKKSDIRMVLEFYQGGNVKKQVCLNTKRAIFIDGNLYRSKVLYFLIEDEIPKTKAPFQELAK